jgi:hypothetical protein
VLFDDFQKLSFRDTYEMLVPVRVFQEHVKPYSIFIHVNYFYSPLIIWNTEFIKYLPVFYHSVSFSL